MLELTIPAGEIWDESKQEFRQTREVKLKLEHSLISISKWEARWKKAYLKDREKTEEEVLDYICCMSIGTEITLDMLLMLTVEDIAKIKAYINDPMTATVIKHPPQEGGRPTGDTITSELIYYWMGSYQIPVQFEKWHLNRLLALIDLYNVKNNPPKKRSMRQIAQSYAELNAQRRKTLGTKG